MCLDTLSVESMQDKLYAIYQEEEGHHISRPHTRALFYTCFDATYVSKSLYSVCSSSGTEM